MLKYRPLDWFLMRISGGTHKRRRRSGIARRVQVGSANSPALVQPLEDRLMLTPEIGVLGDGNPIDDGDTTPNAADETDFGSADVDAGTVTRTFTVTNTGTTALDLSGGVTITGTDAGDFSVTTQPATSVAAAGNTTFVVEFDPSAVGTRSATINIVNDDADENPYDFAIQGEGTMLTNTPPTITSSATATVVEGNTAVLTVTATDPDAPPQDLTFSLISGVDLGDFSINASTGVVTFVSAPDFENPADFDTDNEYEVRVQVSDGTDAVTQDLTVIVTNNLENQITVDLPDGGGDYTVRLVAGDLEVVRNSDSSTIVDTTLGDTGTIAINGTSSPDTVTIDASLAGYTGSLQFFGFGGNDSLNASAIDFGVTFNGGNNADTFMGGSGDDTVNGEAGDDSLDGGAGNDTINGGTGRDLISGGAGNDTIRGETGNDSIDGGDGADRLNGNGGRDTIRGGNDNDTILGGAGRDDLNGEAGNDNVNGQGGSGDIVLGGDGDDVLRGGPNDFIDGTPPPPNSGPVVVLNILLPRSGGTYTLQLVGDQVQLILDLDMSVVSINTLGTGVERIFIQGDTDADRVTLDASLNTFTGEIVFQGSAGNDLLDSSAVTHNIEFFGGGGADTFIGGSGDDSVTGASGRDSLTTGAGNDTVFGGSGDDTIDGGDGDDSISGEFGKDSIIGGAGNDFLNGNAGADTIEGGDGDDRLLGGAQNDSLNGGLGTDEVLGQGGLLDTVDGGGGAGDTVTP